MGMTDNQFKSYRRKDHKDYVELKKLIETKEYDKAIELLNKLIDDAVSDIEA